MVKFFKTYLLGKIRKNVISYLPKATNRFVSKLRYLTKDCPNPAEPETCYPRKKGYYEKWHFTKATCYFKESPRDAAKQHRINERRVSKPYAITI